MVHKLGESAPKVSIFIFEKRNDILKAEGFLWWERFWISQHRIATPTMKRMRRDRRKIYIEAKETEKSHAEYVADIKDMYIARAWFFNDGTFDPFKMIEWYRRQEPAQPTTPQPKRKKVSRDYKRAKQATFTARDKHLK